MGKKAKEAEYFCYILRCADGTLYTGYTTDLEQRLAAHNEGKGARYTMGRRPCQLVHFEKFDTKSGALQREYYIKHRLTRSQKEDLIQKSGSQQGEGKKKK